MEIKLSPPLKHIYVTQPFGANFVDFYAKLGLKGHNGIDFRARRGCPIYASHDGYCVLSGKDGTGGIGIELISSKTGDSFKTIYYHLLKTNIEVSDQLIKRGDLIGWSDNTGKYTTADHLHWELKLTKNGATKNRDNGYGGAIDPTPYLPVGYDQTPAYKRYGREQNKQADFWFRFAPILVKNKWAEDGRWVHRQLKARGMRPLNTEQVNAILYGGWGFDDVINPAMYELYAWVTKDEYNKGIVPFK